MNLLSANTTNHRRIIMFAASEIWGIFALMVVYKVAFTYRDFIFPPLVGLLIFEFLFRTRRYLKLATLPLYVLVIVPVSHLLYGILYSVSFAGGFSLVDSLEYLIYEFPYNVLFFLDTSVVVGMAYYLIKLYRQAGWENQGVGSAAGASNQPIGLPVPVTDLSSFLARYQQQILGFIGWFLVATFLVPWSFGLISTPATIICLIVFGFSKTRKGIAGGILLAVSLNFFIALARGLDLNAWCFMPFYYNGF